MRDTLTIKLDGADREIFMSYGLLNSLVTVIGDPDSVAVIALDNRLRESVLREVLSPRKKSGKKISEIDLDDTEISVDDVTAIIEWVTDHVLDFFVKSLTAAKRAADRNQEAIQSLTPSLVGTKG